MSVQAYNFDERYAMSSGEAANVSVRDVLLAEIPGALNAHQSGEANDKHGTDWWVEHASGKHLSIDCKVREEDWAAKRNPKDDLALETWSVVEKKKIGWTRDATKRSDYILWMWKDTGRWCLIPFHMLCAVFDECWEKWSVDYQTNRQFTPQFGGYHSECVFVPRREVWAAIYRKFAGEPVGAAQ